MPSSVIAHYTYEPQSEVLQITFVSGFVYEYYAVPVALCEAFKYSKSKGIFFNNSIKDKYTFRRVN